MGPEPPPLSGHESVYVLNRGHQLRGQPWTEVVLNEVHPSKCARPYLVTRQADSLEGGHGSGGVR